MKSSNLIFIQLIIFYFFYSKVQILTAQTTYNLCFNNGGCTPTTFLNQVGTANPKFLIGYNYGYLTERTTIFGGNLFVSQSASLSNNYMGKWSFKGAWVLNDPQLLNFYSTQHLVSPGLNYLVDYHRWGNYDAHFGLRERNTDLCQYIGEGGNPPPTPPANPVGLIKDAVISWSYEIGDDIYGNAVTPNRLIFQSINGIDPGAWPGGSTGVYPAVNEHATLLSNGNFGLGISTPLAHFEIKPNSLNPLSDAFHILDANNNSHLIVKNSGNVGIGVLDPTTNKLQVNGVSLFNGNSTINGTALVNGNTTINGNTSITGSTMNITSLVSIQSPVGTTSNQLLFLLKNAAGDPIYFVNNNGDVYLDELADGIDNQMLYINSAGKIYGDAVVSPTNSNTYLIGGNTANSFGDRILGFNDNANVLFKVNGIEAFKVWGKTTTGINPVHYKTGFVEFRRNVSIGGTFASPVECDLNTTLTLKQGQIEKTDNTIGGQNVLLKGYDQNNNLRYYLQSNGIFGLGIDNYIIGNTSYSTGLNYDPYYEHVFLDASKALVLGFDHSGWTAKTGVGGSSQYGLFINNLSSGVVNQVSIGNTALLTQLSNVGSRFAGDVTFDDNLMPEVTNFSNFGSSTKRWNELFLADLNITGSITGNLVSINNGFNSLGTSNNRWNAYIDKLFIYSEITGHMRPTNNTFNLGGPSSASESWNEIYLINSTIQASDKNLKENINYLKYGIGDILKMRPVSYTWKENSNGTRLGFIAQELEEIIPEIIVKDSLGGYGVRYSEIIPILTRGIQEQQLLIDTLKQQINSLLELSKSKNIVLQSSTQSDILNQIPILFQNHPNPVNGITFIDYYLPKLTENAFVRIVDINGKMIKAIALKATGFGQIELECGELSSGVYHYTLLVNGQIVDTKSLIIEGTN